MIWVVIWGFIANAVVLLLGIAIFKGQRKRINYTWILIINAILGVLAALYGVTAGFFTYSDSYIVMSVGAMSIGMIFFCFVPLTLLLVNKE